MERLRDQPDFGGVVAQRAKALLASARPLEASPAAAERVRDRLLHTERMGRRKIVLRPALAIGLLCFAAAAAASVTWVAARYFADQGPAPSASGDRGTGTTGGTPGTLVGGAGVGAAPALAAPALAALVVVDPSWPVVAQSTSVLQGGLADASPLATTALVRAARARPLNRHLRGTAVAALARSRATPRRVDQAIAAPMAETSTAGVTAMPAEPTVATDRAATHRATTDRATTDSAATVPEASTGEEPELSAAEIEPEPASAVVGADAPARIAPSRDEEAALMLRAVTAIRGERNLRRGAALLDELLRRFPRGVMSEVALGLAIETAVLLKEVRAEKLALRYLHRFPDGRFKELAERARAGE